MKDILYFNTLEDIRIIDALTVPQEHDYSQDYLTFEALQDGTFTLTIPANVNSTYMTSVSYSIDGGNTWVTTTIDGTAQTITTPSIKTGYKVLWKGLGSTMAKAYNANNYSTFSSTSPFKVKGNAMSLLYEDNFVSQTSFSGSCNFCGLFENATKLISAKDMILPALTATTSCYQFMFKGCTSLTKAPALPATTLGQYCYYQMFMNCSSLVSTPNLLSTSLAKGCYNEMFEACTSLINVTDLPATTLQEQCYANMFLGCTSLTVAPELPATVMKKQCYANMFQSTAVTKAPTLAATTLAVQCYEYMFRYCQALTEVQVTLPATTLAQACYQFMFMGCTSLKTPPELPALIVSPQSYYAMFANCSALTKAPQLPATTLGANCYQYMFNGCLALKDVPKTLPATTLTQNCYYAMFTGCPFERAPELPAETLVNGCYVGMFNDCSNLNYIKALFTTTPSNTYTQEWVSGVAPIGTFIKNSSATWAVTGVNGIPEDWVIANDITTSEAK